MNADTEDQYWNRITSSNLYLANALAKIPSDTEKLCVIARKATTLPEFEGAIDSFLEVWRFHSNLGDARARLKVSAEQLMNESTYGFRDPCRNLGKALLYELENRKRLNNK